MSSKVKKKKQVGVYGGSFNPVHNGHLILAETVKDKGGFEKIVFIPNGYNPFKLNNSKKSRKHCLKMLKLALSDNPDFEIDTSELEHEGKSYTYNTIKKLKKDNPDTEYTFIIGADLIDEIPDWYKIGKLLKIADFLVVTRPGSPEVKGKLAQVNKKLGSDIKFMEIPEIGISSTEIRNRRFINQSIKYLTPDPVVDYISKHKLYNDKKNKKLLKKIKKFLKKNLDKDRYVHTLGVMETAKDLALRFNADIQKAQIAGLIHDCAKSMSSEQMLGYAKEKGFDIPNEFKDNPATLHAVIGSLMAEEKFGIKDKEILSAVSKHTTGSKTMSKLDKIIYLADYIEPGRTGDYVEEVRELVEDDLNLATLKSVENTIKYLTENNKQVNPSSIDLRESLRKEIENEQTK